MGAAVPDDPEPFREERRHAAAAAPDTAGESRLGGAAQGSARVAGGMAAEGMRLVGGGWPGRCLVMVADGAYAGLEVFWALRERVVCVARCRMDARFFTPPPPRRK